jgi:arylformamidase
VPTADPAFEREYNLRIRHPEREAIYARFTEQSAMFREATPGITTLRYGPGPHCELDFVAAPGGGRRPLFVFIHGGYWRALHRGIFTFLAAPWRERGVHVAMLGYDLAPAVDLPTIVEQIRSAMSMLRIRADELGVRRDAIIVAGHSAGAHLGACVLQTPNWHAAGFVGVSGVYNLEPLRKTSVNDAIHLDAATARAFSPIHRPLSLPTRSLCVAGGFETEGFRQQTRRFVAHLLAAGVDAETFDVAQRNHFDILDDLGDADAVLFRHASALLGPT